VKIEYKRNLNEVVKRYQSLWAGQMADSIMARIQVRDEEVQRDAFMANVPNIPQMLEDYIHYWKTTSRLEDDMLPAIAPNFGTGIEGGYFGAEVSYQEATSWCKHIPDLVNHPERLQYNPNCESVNRMREATEYYLRHNQNRCAVAPPLMDSADDILYMLRGSDIFFDMIDNPQGIRDLLLQITSDMERFKKDVCDRVPSYQDGGFAVWLNWWAPEGMTMLGIDLFCCSSAELYAQIGLPIHQQLADGSGRPWLMHLHSIGLHLIPEILKIPELACLEISEDPNVDLKGFELLQEVRRQVPAELVVKAAIRPGEFLKGIDQGDLPGNTIYDVCKENYQDIDRWDIDYANSLMDKVRKYRI
jgi:hypothetical protein